ncbi:3055_t:CDS:10 [Dentiscutata erythropus]|uniref:3055_t:CDS:1 n=1 Tax=Dentiscutata erythropus TaxID=1348616 RepID=A0A9N9FJU8_9GLOM|nr:3055_t:CDS:10 [Dentiscutata erythropus]
MDSFQVDSFQQIDELIKEYLLFRGFTATFRSFESECRSDKDKRFQAEKIIEELYTFITNSDINGLIDYWKYLDLRYFSRLDARFFGSVNKFEENLLKYYLVYATQQKRKEKVLEFFDTFGTELNGNSGWTKWFGLPFSKDPTTDPNYEIFFTKQWLEMFTISLHNFLNAIFQNMHDLFCELALPSLLCFNLDRLQRFVLEDAIQSLQNEIDNIKNVKAETKSIDTETRQKINKPQESTNYMKMLQRARALFEQKDKNVPSRSQSTTSNKGLAVNSDNYGSKSPEIYADDLCLTPISEYAIDNSLELPGEDINPFTIMNQEIYLEHASGISLAKFSHKGNLIASCDIDNIVRIDNLNLNVTCLEWESRSDKLFLIGTDERFIKIFNKESQSIVHEFQTDEHFPRVKQINCSPVEPLFACSSSSKEVDDGLVNVNGALITWNLKTMMIQDKFILEPSISKASGLPVAPIETLQFNHNGQMLVTGDRAGCIRIFDIRSFKPIMEWSLPKVTNVSPSKKGNSVICSSLFSFDENTVYVVDDAGDLTQWSIHKPGTIISHSHLNGFPPHSSLSPNNSTLTKSSFRKRTSSTSSVRSTKSNKSVSGIYNLATNGFGGGSTNGGTNGITNNGNVNKVPMVSFSNDTKHVLCVGGNGGYQGAIYQTSTGNQVQLLAPHNSPLTVVDWTMVAGNSVLTGATDGSIRVTKMVTDTSKYTSNF